MSSGKKSKNWIPLESNPELLNRYLHTLGVPPNYEFVDVFGVDEDLLGMVPPRCIAVLLLFPHSVKQVEWATKEEQDVKELLAGEGDKEKDKLKAPYNSVSPGMFHIKQTIGNACGTIGVLHSILNNLNAKFPLDGEGYASKYFEKCKGMASYEERGKELEESDEVEESHQVIATEAKSDVNHEINENLHFICFTGKEGLLWELDGMKKRPICHGRTTDTSILLDSVQIVKEFMKRDPDDVRFNMVALILQGEEQS